MPRRAPTPCCHPGCRALVDGRYCDQHQRQVRKVQDERRGSAASRGYGHQWRKARVGYLAKHQLCCRCDEQGRVAAATVVDHITPHRGDRALFWARDNWQPLCKRCHDVKTATEDGAFGR